MNRPTVKITIDALGRPKVEGQDFVGQSCAVATAPFEQALAGGTGMRREYKPEWEQTHGNTVNQEIRW